MSRVLVLKDGGPDLPVEAKVAPPSDLYMTADDALFITSYNSASGIVVAVRYTMMLLNGRVQTGQIDTHVPNTDRTGKTTTQHLGEGFLLDASVILVSGTAKRGQCYVQVGIARGIGASQFVHRIVMQGYVGTAVHLSWPGNRLEQPTEGPGYIRFITGTNPAAGAEASETVPTGARWRLLMFHIEFTTSAAVANRRPYLYFYTGVFNAMGSPWRSDIPASSAKGVNWAIGAAMSAATTGDEDPAFMPSETTLPGGMVISTSTTNLQAADDYSAPGLVVEEWIEP